MRLITGLDHVVIAARDIAAGVAAYETLLGQKAAPVVTSADVAAAVIATSNLAVELMAPVGPGASRLQAALDDGGEGLKSLVFAVGGLDRMRTRCERVGLEPEAIVESETHRSFRANTSRTNGVRLFFLEREQSRSPQETRSCGLDHIVIRTADAERAAALYGARLGLDMRLDRDVMGRRLMFFRCGDLIIEIVEDQSAADLRPQIEAPLLEVGNGS